MTTSKKTKDKKTTEVRKAGDFPKAYIRLRTVLDGLEMDVLRYCLDDKNLQKRLKRIQEVESMVMPIIRALQDKTIKPGDTRTGCGDGLFNCGGVCVPYQCPDSEFK